MNKHFAKLILLLAVGIALFTGCMSSKYVIPASDLRESDSGPMEVLALDGTIYDLKRGLVKTTSIDGNGIKYSIDGTMDTSYWSIPISEIELVQTGRVDLIKHWLVTGSIVVLAVGTGVVTSGPNDPSGEAEVNDPNVPNVGTCPLVFAFDGEDYHLESETFAGAVCRSLEYTTIERLNYLRDVGGAYHLVVANQQPESQFVNELSLFAVDHVPGMQVIPDVNGQLHTIRLPVAPLSAQAFDGRNVTEDVKTADGNMWESELESVDLSVEENLRDGLVCEFPKPAGATQAKLIINGKNTTLCNYVLECMFSQDEIERFEWLHELNTNPAEREKFLGWIIREGGLDISVWMNGNWVKQGWFPNVGPHVSAEKLITLDIHDIEIDTIRIKIESARDLWRIDRIAMDYSDDEELTVIPLPLRSATTESGVDVAYLFAESDSLYYGSMFGDHVQMVFDTVARNPQKERSLIMKSRGYYYKWPRPYVNEVSIATIERVLTEPLYGNRYFLPKWREAKKSYTAKGTLVPNFGTY